jgi:hypothetical protein
MKWMVGILASCFLFSGALPLFSGVDLMAMKKKEDERRKKIAKAKITITDSNVNSISVGNKKYGFVQIESDEPPPEGEVLTPPVAGNQEDETKQPEYWRRQQSQLEERIATLRADIESAQLELNKLWSDFYIKTVASQQQAIREQIAQLTNKIEQKKVFVSETETQLAELLEKARKANVPPGWLR